MTDANDLQIDYAEETVLDDAVSFEELLKRFPQQVGWARWDKIELVGQHDKTSPSCGTWGHFYGCDGGENGERHDFSDLDGHNFKDMMALQRILKSCDSVLCSVCYNRGWNLCSVLVSYRMFLVVSPNFGMVVMTNWNSIIYIIPTVGSNMSNLNLVSTCFSTDTAVTTRPEKHLVLV